ncbi:sensor domain-containing protein [Massilia yuzhufengensis]|uniref:PAS domain S-box-containing protein/diguanylate cyclase (GGDEF) domain-containing protein n=1 Tax=Massilia yuzhufengensis TaxID=1164594 RepID=A0A1I1N960_9BURK|nr:GGDEF and EAL domain-containing protein [Massilia yuzhufengensis]SFC90280.1 PAS domain S-box-containing protein/diguanylate cyclase (GGDEF) domain-containing protein [Massilia yuzhufengensis]
MKTSPDAGSPRRLDDLLEHIPAGVVVHGPDGCILSANRLARELLGQDTEQLVGTAATQAAWRFLRPDRTPMPPGDYPVNVVLRSGAKVSHLIIGVPATSRHGLRWLICNAYPEFDEAGHLHQVVVCFTDCTALKRAKQRLQKSEKRLRLVLKGSTDAPWDNDLATGEVYYSPRWWTMLGYRPGALPVDAGLWERLLHPDDRVAVAAFLRELYKGALTSYSIELRLRHQDGHYVPVLSRGLVLRDEHGKPLRISGTNTDLTERKQVERRIYEAAYYDHLTGLPNRRFLAEELDKALARSSRSGQFGALLFLDLDNFKLLNDTLGHDVGDALLRDVAQRLRLALRHSDGLARLGGDEFVIVLEQLGATASEAAAETGHVVEKLLQALDQPHCLAERMILSTPSIGIVLFEGATAHIDTLLKQADLAMYRAKAEGRNTARFFDPSMQATADRQLALEGALRHGLADRQFVLYCQPQFDRKGRLVGGEVLVRWRRDDGGLVGPTDFIGLAESSGLIGPLGHYVLDESCRALARWRGDRTLERLKLAVNISARQLRSAQFPDLVAGILADTGAPPSRLCLELTESVFAENVPAIIERMQALRRMGIEFSLDDFGTGYSSLSYLKRFPLTALKIDRSFVRDVHVDPDAGPIVEAIIALARKLKLDIVAEGVEHEAQRRFLVSGGCGALQGYLLGQPVPIEEFEHLYSAAGLGHA